MALRVDEYANQTVETVVGGALSAADAYGFVRLKRDGEAFRHYYAAALPVDPSEWIEISSMSNQWFSSADVFLGPAVFDVLPGTINHYYEYFRNWTIGAT